VEGSVVTRSHVPIGTDPEPSPAALFWVIELKDTSNAQHSCVEASFGSGGVSILASILSGAGAGARPELQQDQPL
jgi:hypothetical protein